MKPPRSILQPLARFFSESGFPLFMLAVLAVWQAVLIALVFAPADLGRWGGLASDFRVWCLSYNPATGAMDWTAAWIMLSQPPILALLLYGVWHGTLRNAWSRSWKSVAGPAVAGIVVAALTGGALYAGFSPDPPDLPLEFPGERIRTALPAPEFALENQAGATVSLRDFEGKVVLMTGIYTTCGATCPMLILQSLEAVDALPETLRSEVVFVAVTLDPENDTPEAMAALARRYGVGLPNHQFLTGDPEHVNRVLDHLQIARQRNEQSGQIDHANLFFLVDRNGRIAYRFNLGERHESWVAAALRTLVDESPHR